MQMQRVVLMSLFCLLIASCVSQPVMAGPTPTNTPLPSATSNQNPTITPLPASIVEGAFRSGMPPEEIVSFYLEICSYLENNDINAMANKIHFPLNECGRNKGDNIETKDEFIQRFNEIFTNEVISSFVHANLENTHTDMYGVYIGGIWFTSICTDKTCNTTETWIFGVNGYCSIRRTPPMDEQQVANLDALPDYSGENFIYGTYKMEAYEDHEHLGLITEEEINKWKNIDVKIEKANYSTDSDCIFGCNCASPEYEFNKPFYDRYRALSFGIPAVGELIMICNGNPQVYFDILADDRLGYYYYGYFITLVHQ